MRHYVMHTDCENCGVASRPLGGQTGKQKFLENSNGNLSQSGFLVAGSVFLSQRTATLVIDPSTQGCAPQHINTPHCGV